MSTQMSKSGDVVERALPVAICGAGVAGLVLAVKLAALGFKPVVFESRTEHAVSREGKFLTLAPNGMNGLRAIDCCEDVIAAGIDTKGIEILNAKGRRLGLANQEDVARVFGAPSITIRRGTLAQILLKKAQEAGIAIHFNRRVIGVSQSNGHIDLQFDDSPTFTASLLFASDGLRSSVRKIVFPEYPEPKFTGLIGTGGIGSETRPSGRRPD